MEGNGVLGEGEGDVLADTSSDLTKPTSSELELSMSRSSRMERGAMLSMLVWWSCLEQRQGVSYNSTAS